MKYHFSAGNLKEAEALVMRYHYSQRTPGGTMLVVCLHEDGGLFGDTGEAIAACFFGTPPTRWSEPVIELTRLVRKPDMKPPLVSLISFGIRILKKRRVGLVVSFADSTQGHHGGVYQAASWEYAGKRDRACDGLIVNGQFTPGRTCNANWGTRSPERLCGMHPEWDIKPHYDEGKHCYFKTPTKAGKAAVARLGLSSLPYPKPRNEA